MEDSIFTKIIRGEIPCHKIYEDDMTFVFLDIHPKTSGHCLVVPKKQVEFVWDLDSQYYEAVMATTQKVAKRLREVMDKSYVGQMITGIDVPHAHVHVFPFANMEEYSYRPDMNAEPNHEALAELAKKIAF